MRKQSLRPSRLARVALLVAALCAPGLDAEECEPIGAVFVAESGGVIQISTSDGTLVSEISAAGDVRALALDRDRQTLWLYSQFTLFAFDFAGEQTLAAPLALADSPNSFLTVQPANTFYILDNLGSKIWHNPETGESLNPDLGHPEHGDHWDWSHRGPGGKPGYRLYPDGRVVPKGG